MNHERPGCTPGVLNASGVAHVTLPLRLAKGQRIRTLVLALGIAATACRPGRTVTVAWDVPASLPDGYRVLVDDRIVLDMPPPSADPACSCLKVDVPVPPGRHTVSVVAYNRASGASKPSASVTVE